MYFLPNESVPDLISYQASHYRQTVSCIWNFKCTIIIIYIPESTLDKKKRTGIYNLKLKHHCQGIKRWPTPANFRWQQSSSVALKSQGTTTLHTQSRISDSSTSCRVVTSPPGQSLPELPCRLPYIESLMEMCSSWVASKPGELELRPVISNWWWVSLAGAVLCSLGRRVLWKVVRVQP